MLTLALLISDHDLNLLMVWFVMPLLALGGIGLTLLGFGIVTLKQPVPGLKLKPMRWQGPLLFLIAVGFILAKTLL